jgi:hypothetical protein
LTIRDTRGTTPVNNNTLTGDPSGDTVLVNTDTDPIVTINQIRTSPFGTFAGGNFFGARGVWITNMDAGDANSYELIDSNGVSRSPPTSVAISVSGLASGDKVSVFRATDINGTIEKDYLALAAGNTSGLSTLTIDASTPIPTDTPSEGAVRVVDTSDLTVTRETRYTYTSWVGQVFSGISPVLDRTYTAIDDTAYVPYIDTTASGPSVSVSVQYVEDRNISTRVRRKGILPFSINTTSLTVSGYSATAIRTFDSIVD